MAYCPKGIMERRGEFFEKYLYFWEKFANLPLDCVEYPIDNGLKTRNNRSNHMLMKTKKVFAAPRVLQAVEVHLEEDFLTGASNVSLIWISGHEIGEEINSEDTWTLD